MVILLVVFTLLLSFSVPITLAYSDYSKIIVWVGNIVRIEVVTTTSKPHSILEELVRALSMYNVEKGSIEEIKDNTYSITVRIVDWDKRLLKLNLTPVISYLRKPVELIIKPDKFLNVVSEPTSGTLIYGDKLTVKVSVEVNYRTIMLGLCANYIPPLISSIIILQYVKRKVNKIKGKDYYTVSKALNRMRITIPILMALVTMVPFILSIILTDYPGGISFVTGLPLEVTAITIFVSLFIIMVTPLIYSMKYTCQLYGESRVKPVEYVYAFLYFTPPILVFTVILVVMQLTPEDWWRFIGKLPLPLRVAQGFLFGFTLALIFFTVIDRIMTSRLEKPLEPWIKDMVNEIVDKLGLKRFKRVRKIRTIGGRIANAMVKGVFNKELILTERLIEILDREELKSVIAHEVAHHKYKHIELMLTLWVLAGILIFTGISYLMNYIGKLKYEMLGLWDIIGFILYILLFVSGFVALILLTRYISRRAEEKADLEASKIIANPRVYIRALAKTTIANLGPMKVNKILEKFETHPSPIKRMLETAKRHNIPESEVKEVISQVLSEIQQQTRS